MENDVVAAWEKRNAVQLEIELAALRAERIIVFPRVAIMRSVLVEAVERTANACDLPRDKCRAAIMPSSDGKTATPGIEIEDTVIYDQAKVSAVFGRAFRVVSAERMLDIAFVAYDAKIVPLLAEQIPRKETLEEFATRLKHWLPTDRF